MRSERLALLIRGVGGTGIVLVLAAVVRGLVGSGALPTEAVDLAALPSGLAHARPSALGTLGVLILLATPPLAVLQLGVGFLRARDRVFAAVAAGVIGFLAAGLATAWLGRQAPVALPSLALAPQLGVAAAGVVSGALGVMLGLGGGVFIVPVLSIFFGVPLKVAIAASAVSVVVNSLGGSAAYLRAGLTNVRLGLLMELTTVLGAVIGGRWVVALAPELLRGVFGLALVVLAALMLLRPGHGDPIDGGDDPLRLRGVFRDRSTDREVAYVPQRLALGLGLSSVAGVMSGLLGIGGGAVKMPLLHTVMRVPAKAAAATSVFMVGITVSASAFIYYASGLVDLSVVVPAVLGILVGSPLGAAAAHRARGALVVRLLVAILLYLGILLLLQAFGVRVPGAAAGG